MKTIIAKHGGGRGLFHGPSILGDGSPRRALPVPSALTPDSTACLPIIMHVINSSEAGATFMLTNPKQIYSEAGARFATSCLRLAAKVFYAFVKHIHGSTEVYS